MFEKRISRYFHFCNGQFTYLVTKAANIFGLNKLEVYICMMRLMRFYKTANFQFLFYFMETKDDKYEWWTAHQKNKPCIDMSLAVLISVQRHDCLHLNFQIDLAAMHANAIAMNNWGERPLKHELAWNWMAKQSKANENPVSYQPSEQQHLFLCTHCQVDNVITDYMNRRLCAYVFIICSDIVCTQSSLCITSLTEHKRIERGSWLQTIVID